MEQQKKISIKLMVGIIFIPIIFSWFTLRKGYSKITRIGSFLWLGISVILIIFSNQNTPNGNVSVIPTQNAINNFENGNNLNPSIEQVFNFESAAITKENIQLAISKLIDVEKISSIEVTNENEKNIVDIHFTPGTVWNEKDLVNQTCQNAIAVMEVLFTNSKIDKVWFWSETELTDAKGNSKTESVMNVALSKENAADINWIKFKDMVLLDYNSLLKIADSYVIHPAIREGLK